MSVVCYSLWNKYQEQTDGDPIVNFQSGMRNHESNQIIAIQIYNLETKVYELIQKKLVGSGPNKGSINLYFLFKSIKVFFIY